MSSRPSRGAARLASILDALPDALLLVNANGTVVNANAIALETFETPGTALVGRGLLDLLPEFDPKRIPGSMRSPREAAQDTDTRTKPTRMTAHRTDGSAFPAQVTSANLEDARTPYADFGDGMPHYTGDELLMLVVRDLSGTVDTEAELARQQRQTEMILRAAAEGVVGVDTAGKVVLVNPSAAQILGHRATDLGGKELHPLVHHSRPDGSPLAYEETPLADTLRSGRKHRVRGQVLWRKDGKPVPVDLTTAPVRDGDQLVGAVMTFTDRTQYDALAARAAQLRALLDSSLRGPLAELRGELGGLAADPAGQLWPEANQILHHLTAGYARITTLIDNVLAFQRLDRGEDKLRREPVGLDDLAAAAVEGAVELIGPGRAQYAVHAPQTEVSVDGEHLARALSHLIADVAGVDSAGNAIALGGDSTIVVAAARRGDVVRIDVHGPSAGGDPVHLPLARGVVERHGGVLQTHEVPGQGSAYVLEVPVGPEDAGETASGAAGAARAASAAGGTASPAGGRSGSHGRGRAAAGEDAGSDTSAGTGTGAGAGGGTGSAGATGSGPRGGAGSGAGTDAGGGAGSHGRRGAGRGAGGRSGSAAEDASPVPGPRDPSEDTGTVVAPWAVPAVTDHGDQHGDQFGGPHGDQYGGPHGDQRGDQQEAPSGRRRALRRPREEGEPQQGRQAPALPGGSGERDGAAFSAGADGPAAHGEQPSGRRARRGRAAEEEQPPAAQMPAAQVPAEQAGRAELPAPPIPNALPPAGSGGGPTGRRARRAIEPANPVGPVGPIAVPPQGAGPQAAWPAPQEPQPGLPAVRHQEPAAQAAEWQDAQGGQDAAPGRPALRRPGTSAPNAEWQDAGSGQDPQAAGTGRPALRRPGTSAPNAEWQDPQAPAPGRPAPQRPGTTAPAAAEWQDAGSGHDPQAAGTGRPALRRPGTSAPGGRGGRPEVPAPAEWPGPHDPRTQSPQAAPAQPGAQPAVRRQGPSPQAAEWQDAQGGQGAAPGRPAPQRPGTTAPAAAEWQDAQGSHDPQAAAAGRPALRRPGTSAPGGAWQDPDGAQDPRTDPRSQGGDAQEPGGRTGRRAAGERPGTSAPGEQPGASGAPGGWPEPGGQGGATQWPGPHAAEGGGNSADAWGPAAAAAQAGDAHDPRDPHAPEQGPGHDQGQAQVRPQAQAQAHQAQAHAQAQGPAHGQSHGRAISVRTLGQGVVPYAGQPELPAPGGSGGSGRRRRLGAPQQSNGSILPRVPSQPVPAGQPTPGGETQARQHPQADPDSGQLPVRPPVPPAQSQHPAPPAGAPGAPAAPVPPMPPGPPPTVPPGAPAAGNDPQTALLRPVRAADPGRGRSYAIGAPAAGAAEGPEPLDGPNGAVDVTDDMTAGGPGADDRQEEPLEEPRRLLVWPEPDVSTRQALTDRGYRPVIVRSREEVDAQVAEPPAALFVDPLTGPITRTALQSLRQAAAAAQVPVLVTAGLGQATREAAYGADPAVLLKALAPRDSEQHPPRVLLVESHEPIAQAFAATLERRGMQVTHASSETDAMTQAAQIHPNLVVMDLMLIRRRRQGIVDWLRGHARLDTTPLVVYTSADIEPSELPRLASGETVLFLAERSTSSDVQARIVDLLGKIGA
ncbi:PAS domain-containing protein [Actinacidiphila sp. DG2A-62]|uniref:response regulator n=1 Tax=Actinacidiphila sp. DG2A-62 TaxID=3108821 RepID=UPI002DBA6354|nr:PAS domain-containing protein [Actinacidiphila sp. DG2A-62]MEC3995540.1 PAS domain-containing protein [Actinacidiphila sp. DG2A-62]